MEISKWKNPNYRTTKYNRRRDSTCQFDNPNAGKLKNTFMPAQHLEGNK